jgi:serine/threonine-protein kinase
MHAMNDRPDHRDDPHPSADLDIDLEPAEGLGRSRENAATTTRLRSGLTAVAGFLTLFHLLFIVIKATGPASGPASVSDAPTWSLLLRAVVAGIAFVLLRYAPRLTGWQVRALELFLLGFEMLTLLAAQYLSGMDLIDQHDLVDAVAVQKNGVIRTLVLMVCWGIFVPRDPAATARTVVTMAAALILCHGVVLHHADTAHLNMDDVANHQIVMSNALFLIMGVALSTLAAWVLRGRDADQNADHDTADRVGPYRLIRKLDEGGAGEVYLAEHEFLKRQCGLKIVHNGGPDVAARFEREARAAAQLLHPNTVAVFDAGRTADGSPYLAMEYLPGRCSADIVHDSGPMPSSRAVHLGRQVCGALTEAHRLGLVHRDLSPSNVFVSILGGRCDVAKLLDFGAVGETTRAAGHAPAPDGLVAGTPEYAAPERAFGSSEVDCRADVYGLGGLLYFLVTGQPPFVRDTPADVLRAHVSEPVTPPREHTADIPADVEAVILRCLAKRPEDRFPDTRAVADALAACGCAPEWNDARAEAWWLEQASASAEESGPLSPQA